MYGSNWHWALRVTVLTMRSKSSGGKIVIIGHNRLQSEKHLEYVRDHIREWCPDDTAVPLVYTPTKLTFGVLRVITATSFDSVAVSRDVVIFEDGMGVVAERLLTDEWRGYRPNREK